MTLTSDLLTYKKLHQSHLISTIFPPILGFLDLSVSELWAGTGHRQTDGWTDVVQTLIRPPIGRAV